VIRPPSSQKKYDAFYSRDPAIIQLPDDATDEQKADRERRIQTARDSGRWDDVVVPGEAPTLFGMRQLTGDQYGDLASRIVSGEKRFAVFAAAFRLALQDVRGLPDDVKVEFFDHPTYGRMATTSFLEKAGIVGSLAADIMFELGELAFVKARSVDPKS
jgi:hypothetical protein